MKTLIRIDIEAETLDEIDRRAIAANMSRSEYVAFLVGKFPLLVVALDEALDEWGGWVEEHSLYKQTHVCAIQRSRALLESCQTTEIQTPDGESST